MLEKESELSNSKEGAQYQIRNKTIAKMPCMHDDGTPTVKQVHADHPNGCMDALLSHFESVLSLFNDHR